MATVVNARDVKLQATTPRVEPVSIPPNITVPVAQIPEIGEFPQYVGTVKEVVLIPSGHVFNVPTVGAITPANISLTAVLKNIVGTPTFTVVEGTASLNVSGNTATILSSSMTTPTVVVEVSVLASSTTFTDRVTIVRAVQDGGVVGLLTNERVAVAATMTGDITPTSLSLAGGTFYVFSGSNDRTGTNDVAYSIVSATGVSITIASTGRYTIHGVSAENATATLRAVCNGVTVDRVYSIRKVTPKGQTIGSQGTLSIAKEIKGTTWSDAEAFTAVAEAGYTNVVERDIVTLYNTAANFSESRFFSGGKWVTLDAYVNGNMLVRGTVTAEKMRVDSLSAITANLGLMRTATSGQRTEIDSNGLRSYDSAGNLRVRVGVW